MADIFYWTGDDGSTDEPDWIVDAPPGAVVIENGGTPEVCLVIHSKQFPRFSLITRRDVDPSPPVCPLP